MRAASVMKVGAALAFATAAGITPLLVFAESPPRLSVPPAAPGGVGTVPPPLPVPSAPRTEVPAVPVTQLPALPAPQLPAPAPQFPPLPAPPATVPRAAPEAKAASAQVAPPTSGEAMVGTFRLQPGSCGGTGVTGSYFRFVQPGGSSAAGPFTQNMDSACADRTYTPVAPGSDGGLVTGAYQPHPDPAFTTAGGGRAGRITRPQRFSGVELATATSPVDPQTSTGVPTPSVFRNAAGQLGGDLRAFAVAWNGQHLNQGAPKPDGRRAANTFGPSGTYDPSSRTFVLEWSSQIVGGMFNNFTGQWHLVGTFVPASAPSPSPQVRSEPAVVASAPGPVAPSPPASGPSPAGAPAPTARTGGVYLAAAGASLVALAVALAWLVRLAAGEG